MRTRQWLCLFACLWLSAAAAAPIAYVPFRGGIAVFDTASNTRIWELRLPDTAPGGVAISPDGTRAYFGDAAADQVYVVDATRQSVVTRITVARGPVGLAVNPAGTRLAVGSAGTLLGAGSTLSLIDTTTNTVIATAETGLRPAAALFSADGNRIYVANGESHTITVHDAQTLQTLETIPVALGPLSLALHPAGNHLYVGHIGTLFQQVSVVSVVNLASHSVTATINAGIRPALVVLNAAGTRLYVGNVESDSISVVDTATNTVLSTIPIDQSPTGLDLTPDGTKLYVPMHTTSMAIVDLVNQRVAQRVYAEKMIVLGRFITPAPPASQGNAPSWTSGMWWNADESGWGLSVTQRGGNYFLAWYTYDATGAPKWYIASRCEAYARYCSGRLYEVTGSRFFGAPFNPSATAAKDVGYVSVSFTDADTGSLYYSMPTQSRSIDITRAPLSTGSVPGVNYTDLWWNASESGWGLSVAQQGRVMFLAWFVYDDAGKPMWYVATNCAVNAAGNGCTGALHRTTGPAFGPTFNSASVHAVQAGTVSLSFTDGNNGVLSYTVDGRTGTKAITRALF
ncbi:hypothetical protein DSM104443_02353 [Usitatibacter rugosus]|uniref:YVTN family beta-propeller protein n=1 Tax=Usitatibacter rugosus TaxID=2732067 RepID=A0A6M4GVG8_9PROT|nr:YncE family protein [Usitatibacter rugosus]QJR11280.1 hypothetical protein DSM104443_02353 [Usitatibacter rugosus]